MPKPKESAPLFEEPKFDEASYLETEKNRALVIIVIFLIGALSGLLAGYLQFENYAYLSVLLFLAIVIVLGRLLKAIGLKVSDRTSHKAINYLIFFVVFLLFWIIFLNPPLHTVSSPQITEVQNFYGDQWVSVSHSTGDIYIINNSIVSNGYFHFSVHLSYRYGFNVTNLFVALGSGTSVTPSGNWHYYSNNGTLQFTQTIQPKNGDYKFSIQWSSDQASSTSPLDFVLRPSSV